MRSLPVAALAVVLALPLAGCSSPTIPFDTPPATSAAKPTTSAVPEASAEPAPQPEDVAAASFLLEGTPGTFDAEGYWKGHYGFFTDASKTVRCDIWIFSGDSGGVACGVTPGNEGLVTYALPATDCASSNSDGYTVAINFKAFESTNTGFTGCGGASVDPALASATPVLLDHQTLRIPTAVYVYTCTVAGGVASCDDSYSGASIHYGVGVAEFAG